MGCHSDDFNAINRWRLAELAPSDLLRSIHCNLSEVDEAELVRTKWMWTRKPKSFLQDGLSGYLALAFLGVVLLFLPHVGMMLRTPLLFRHAHRGRQRCDPLRPLETRIRSEHRPTAAKPQKAHVDRKDSLKKNHMNPKPIMIGLRCLGVIPPESARR